MESHNVEMGGGSSGTPANSRWNPTKEQISILENLYKQGIRTPSAEQIQHITARLRAYGHIEGKNVFYWFQNHKARQRQKQKQESIACFNHFLHRAQPIFSSPLCPNVICAPYYLPHSEMGFYPQPQHPKVLLPGAIRRNPRNEKVVPMAMPRNCDSPQVREQMQQRIPDDLSKQETLALFPLHPTGIMEEKLSSLASDSSIATPSGSPDNVDDEDGGPGNQPFIDFFSSGQGC